MPKKKHRKPKEDKQMPEIEVKEQEVRPEQAAQEGASEETPAQTVAEEPSPAEKPAEEAVSEDIVVPEPEDVPEPLAPGRKIRALRRRQGFKKKRFAKLLGIKVSELEALEAGDAPLTVEIAKAVDAACCVSWKMLF